VRAARRSLLGQCDGVAAPLGVKKSASLAAVGSRVGEVMAWEREQQVDIPAVGPKLCSLGQKETYTTHLEQSKEETTNHTTENKRTVYINNETDNTRNNTEHEHATHEWKTTCKNERSPQ
jgi:hypothetical protein